MVAGSDGVALTPADLPLDISMDQALEQAAAKWSSRVGWVFEDERITFAEMRQRSYILAGALADVGVGRGDVVAVWLPASPEWAYTFFACSRLGALMVPLNTRWSADEAGYVLDHCKAAALVFRPRFLNIDYRRLLGEIDPSLAAAVPHIDAGDPRESEPLLLPLRRSADASDVRPVRDLVASGEAAPSGDALPQDPLLVQYTSGSTARPKGAVLSHTHVLNFGIELHLRMGVQFGESVLNKQPLYHAGGSCGAVPVPLTLGCTMVMPEYYTPSRALRLLERERCVASSGMPTMYLRELELEDFRDFDTSSLRAGFTIGPPGTLDRIRDEYPLEGLFQVYACSEAGQTCGELSDPWDIRRRSVGRPFVGTEVGIFDPDTGERLGVDETGEIRIRGTQRLLGYLGESTPAVDADGWFPTRDLGWLDEEGRLFYDGRLKEMVKPGGENVSAREVESVLSTHEAVGQVAVIGVPDPDLIEAVAAVIELAPGYDASPDELREFCADRLTKFKVPRHFLFVDEMPLTDSGKIKKAVLVERYSKEFVL